MRYFIIARASYEYVVHARLYDTSSASTLRRHAIYIHFRKLPPPIEGVFIQPVHAHYEFSRAYYVISAVQSASVLATGCQSATGIAAEIRTQFRTASTRQLRRLLFLAQK